MTKPQGVLTSTTITFQESAKVALENPILDLIAGSTKAESLGVKK